MHTAVDELLLPPGSVPWEGFRAVGHDGEASGGGGPYRRDHLIHHPPCRRHAFDPSFLGTW